MTAPVAVAEPGPDGLTMRFFMPAQFTRATLPEPTDPGVRIVAVPEETVAVLRFTGSTGQAAVALFYDPPWTLPFRRRNEVTVPVVPGSYTKRPSC